MSTARCKQPRVIGLLSVLLAASAGCQQDKEQGKTSQAKAPEALALASLVNGKVVRIGTCKGDLERVEPQDLYEVPVFISTEDPQREADLDNVARLSLSAIPYDLKKLFMIAGGKIFITNFSDARRACGQDRLIHSYASEADDANNISCVHHVGDPASAVSGLNLIMSDSPTYVSHILVRNFGYVMTQYFAWNYMTTDETGQVKTANPMRFNELRNTLTAAYLQDMAASRVFPLSRLDGLFGPGGEAQVRTNLAEIAGGKAVNPLQGVPWTKDPTQALKEPFRTNAESAFGDFVLGEVFDAYYCDATGPYDAAVANAIKSGGATAAFSALENTRRVLEDFYPLSNAAFAPLRDHFLELGNAARNSFNLAAGLTMPRPAEHRYGDGPALPGAGLGLDDGPEPADAALALDGGPRQLTQAERTQIDRQVTQSPAYLAAQQRITDLQSKKANSWVAGGYRYDAQIQQAQFDAAKVRNEQFAKQSSQVLGTPVEPSYKGGPLEDVRKTYNAELNKQLDQSNQNLKAYVKSGVDLAKEQGDKLIDYGNNSSNPWTAALAAGSGKLLQDTSKLSAKVTNAVGDGITETAKGLGKADQPIVDGVNHASDVITDVQKAATQSRTNGGDTLDALAAGSKALGQKTINGIADASLSAEAEWGRMKGAYADAQRSVTDQAVELTKKGYDPAAAALLAVGENVDKANKVLPTPLQGIAALPTSLISNEAKGGRALAEGRFDDAQNHFSDAAIEGGGDILKGAADTAVKDKVKDIWNSKAGPASELRRGITANIVSAQRKFDNAVDLTHTNTKDRWFGDPASQAKFLDKKLTELAGSAYDKATEKIGDKLKEQLVEAVVGPKPEAGKSPAEKPPGEQVGDNRPSEVKPPGEKAPEQKPAGELNAEQKPAGELGAEQKPAGELGAEQKPVEPDPNKPVEEQKPPEQRRPP